MPSAIGVISISTMYVLSFEIISNVDTNECSLITGKKKRLIEVNNKIFKINTNRETLETVDASLGNIKDQE